MSADGATTTNNTNPSSSSPPSKPKSNKIAFAVIRMPDGIEHEIPLPPKTFSSGREGCYAQIPGFFYNDEVYGGQIQVWKKGEKGQQKA
ncbi:hypothetical protein NTE_00555 [Candidatus Nitrososphaera evergladensis SR1]|uniref:Uncharacterized protein n=1 Tax=Candidatus Nitrososphaera evergladensis SR1 TaxID=1459636 RepID=A0A075MMD4_9ARCH|nr:hypothetical protein [Candidatus Nitrososphaera evergladensis]AIF82636.1 hypothetical protein NTE_00555 [Candidatus Nitrososphaera evergladensis SR1]